MYNTRGAEFKDYVQVNAKGAVDLPFLAFRTANSLETAKENLRERSLFSDGLVVVNLLQMSLHLWTPCIAYYAMRVFTYRTTFQS